MKILITSASTGAGHVRAAEAIEAAIREAHPDVHATHVNILDLVAKPFRKVYEDGYVFLADRAPTMWSWLYEATDKRGNNGRTLRVINAFQRNCAAPFLKFLEKSKPDVIVSTHFLAAQILSSGSVFPSIPLETVITDYELHHVWLNPLIRRYYVADESMIPRFTNLGINANRVAVTGIPIHPVFSQLVSAPALRSRYGLNPFIPTLLFLSGGLGFGAIEQRVRQLFSLPDKLQIITVSGKNSALLARMKLLKPPPNISLTNLGFVTNMHEWLSVADLVITKTGGLTTAECLAKGAPMLAMSAIPGQEQRNADFVVSKGAGLQARSLEHMGEIITSLVRSESDLAVLRANARKTGKPDAAFAVASSALASFMLA